MNIDMHAHLIPQAFWRATRDGGEWHGTRLEQDSSGKVFLVWGTTRLPMNPAWNQTPEQRVEHMRTLDVDMHAVSLSPFFFPHDRGVEEAVDTCREVNGELGEMTRSFPQHFVGLGTVPMQDTRIAVRELERAITRDAVKGVIIPTSIGGRNLDDPDLRPFFEAAESLGALVYVHPWQVAGADRLTKYNLAALLGFPFESAIAIASLIFGGVLDRYPRLRLYISHGGGFACWGMGRLDYGLEIIAKDQHPRRLPGDYLREMHYDCVTHSYEALQHLVSRVSVDRVVLGSDYPFPANIPRVVQWIEECGFLDAEQKKKIQGTNAARLLGFQEPAS